jgi:hypothetical protein
MRHVRDAELLEEQLGANETLIWTGTSNSERLLIRSDYFFVSIGAILAVLALGAFIASLLAVFAGDGAAAFIGLIVSIAVGVLAIFLMFGRLIRRFGRAKLTSYAITSERVIEIVGSADRSGQPTVRSIALADEPKASFVDHFERRGSITVGPLKLENINDAAVVYELLSAELAKAARGGSAAQ